MKLDEAQRQQVSAWIEQGLKLSEIQSKLGAELGISMTYMDVRFLIDDLKLQPKDPTPPAPAPAPVAPAKQPASPAAAQPAPGAPSPLAPEGAPTASSVSVTVDQIARPGAMVSGRVTFSDAQGASWLIDQTGRPGLVPDQQGYRPAPADIAQFQIQLQDELARIGF